MPPWRARTTNLSGGERDWSSSVYGWLIFGSTWPPPARVTPFDFHADHTLRPAKPTGEGKLTYAYDPQDPVRMLGGQNLTIAKGPMDQRPVESRRDVLLFATEPLTEPLEITGRITARLWISSDCPDTDFRVKLYDVFPHGKSFVVTDGIQRASLHKSLEQRELLVPDCIYDLPVDPWSTSMISHERHRIRVAVSSSNSPCSEPNANTGCPHPLPGKTRVTTNTLHLFGAHPPTSSCNSTTARMPWRNCRRSTDAVCARARGQLRRRGRPGRASCPWLPDQ